MSSAIRSQLFRVLDTETTGLDPKTDAIVELAWAIVRGDGTVLSSDCTLINPGRPISADAFRIHGISDSDVANAPTLEQAVESHSELHTPVLTAVCHNAGFDSVFLRRSRRLAEGNPRFLCTLRLAQNLVPGCQSYGLESLNSHLGLVGDVDARSLHRAPGDVATTCSLLKHLIDRYLAEGHPDDIEELFKAASLQRMPFGKHKGRLLSEVPVDYLDWLLERDIDDELRTALKKARAGVS
jgi:DNA polymerase III epsilon subunit-like protein